MFDSPSTAWHTLAMAGPRTPSNAHALLLDAAVRLFNRAMAQGWVEQVKAALLHRHNQLIDLNTIHVPIVGRHANGLGSVRLDEICATLGRASDFDRHFYPRSERTRERWQSVAVARLQGTALPAVTLIKIGPRYCVLDGHHRISVAQALRQVEIDAEVTVWEVAGRLPWDGLPLPQPVNVLDQPTAKITIFLMGFG